MHKNGVIYELFTLSWYKYMQYILNIKFFLTVKITKFLKHFWDPFDGNKNSAIIYCDKTKHDIQHFNASLSLSLSNVSNIWIWCSSCGFIVVVTLLFLLSHSHPSPASYSIQAMHCADDVVVSSWRLQKWDILCAEHNNAT